MEYKFKNNGLEYVFRDNYCGGGQFRMLHYDWDIIDIKLTTEEKTEQRQESKLFGLIKNTINNIVIKQFIIISYKENQFKDEITEKKIPLELSEYSQAKIVVDYVRKIIVEKNKKIQEEEQKHLVSITHPNGKVEMVKDYLILEMEDYVLFSDGGRSYHKCTGCFKKWPDLYREKFDGWKLISMKDANEKNLKLCNYCEEAMGLELDDIFEDTEEEQNNFNYSETKINDEEQNVDIHICEISNIKNRVETELVEINKNILQSLKKRYIALDFETTGLNCKDDRIIEIGALVFENGIIIDKFQTFINSNKEISLSASKVNNITNEMIQNAPMEESAFKSFVQFLGDAIKGDIIVCSHNARFEMDFLSETLNRLGYQAKFKFIDTLYLSRNLLKELDNHKQDTIARYFEIINEQTHRALTDAEVCGKILWNLLKLKEEELEKIYQSMEKNKPTDEELEVCAFIQKIIIENDGDTEWLRFIKNSSNYIDVRYLYSFLKFKFSKNGKYILLPKKIANVLELFKEPCTLSEGGTEFIRVYFNNPFELECIKDYILKEYKSCKRSALGYIKNNKRHEKEARKSISLMFELSNSDMETLLARAKERKEKIVQTNEKTNIKETLNIKKESIEINPTNSRVPLSEILNLNNSSKGFNDGYTYWLTGETLRKDDSLELAIQMYDKARYNGYCSPALYESYAMTYHKLKDYENEIAILDEGIKRERNFGTNLSRLETRREKAFELLYKQRIIDKQKVEKEELARKKKEEQERKKLLPKIPKGRSIIQLNDDMEIIKIYSTISEAVRETGINSKSIRDAANGVQKHAGGFVWKFKD